MNGGKFLSSVLLGTFATVITSSTTTSAVSITKERLNRIKEMVPNADIKEISAKLKSVSNINEKLDKIFNREDAKDILECLFGNEDFIDSSLKRIFSSKIGKDEYVFDKIIHFIFLKIYILVGMQRKLQQSFLIVKQETESLYSIKLWKKMMR